MRYMKEKAVPHHLSFDRMQVDLPVARQGTFISPISNFFLKPS